MARIKICLDKARSQLEDFSLKSGLCNLDLGKEGGLVAEW